MPRAAPAGLVGPTFEATAEPREAPIRQRPGAPLGSRIGRALTIARLVHPFPSLLDGIVVAVVALVAGGTPTRAALLGASVVCLQFAIGTLNDLVDAPRDARTRAGKPMADGLVSGRTARAVLGLCLAAGLILAVVGGPLLLLVAAIGLAIGVWYDLGAKGTPWSWLPIALGVPLLPVYGWLGATGALPAAFAVLIPAAVLGGAGLAIANSVVDLERDVAAAATSLAVVLGPTRSTAVVLLLQMLVAGIAIASCGPSPRSGPWFGATVATATLPVAGALLGILRARRGPVARELAFEVQAVGLALLAVAWVNALGASVA